MIRKPVGSDLRKAITAINTHNLILNAKAAPKVGGKVDSHRLTQVGRALRELGVQ